MPSYAEFFIFIFIFIFCRPVWGGRMGGEERRCDAERRCVVLEMMSVAAHDADAPPPPSTPPPPQAEQEQEQEQEQLEQEHGDPARRRAVCVL